ncbi:MAG TPA: flagellar basal body L-ring protein FlgH [Armatimonadota bacterium]
MKRTGVLIGVVIGLCAAGRADSLWKSEPKPEARASSGSMYVDMRAAKVGDLVTILVTETSSATQQASTSVTKKDTVNTAAGAGALLRILPAWKVSGSTDAAAQGSTARSANLTARITAKVIAVNPNGTLTLEGTRDVKANDETQMLRITGTVRREDIASDNTVQSAYLADAKIDYTGKGPIAERQKPGLITRIFKILF